MKNKLWRYATIEEIRDLLNSHKITEINKSETQPRNLDNYHDILSLELDNGIIIEIPLFSSDLTIREKRG